jgi:hypothetical protein
MQRVLGEGVEKQKKITASDARKVKREIFFVCFGDRESQKLRFGELAPMIKHSSGISCQLTDLATFVIGPAQYQDIGDF